MAVFVWIATYLRAVLVALQLMDRRRLRPPDDVECDRLMGVTAEAANFQMQHPEKN